MGYDVHITRKERWFDDDGPAISIDEWSELVANDSEMRMDGHAEASTPDGSVIRVENEGLAVWIAYAGHGESGNMAWFSYRSGNITIKNPDVEILTKMWAVAHRLSAQVQGDECELYDKNGEIY